MSFAAWIALGLLAGFVASKRVNKSGAGMVLDIVLGVVGAVVGGYLFQTFGKADVTGLNIYSILVSLVGAVVVLALYHAVAGRRARVYVNAGDGTPSPDFDDLSQTRHENVKILRRERRQVITSATRRPGVGRR